MSEAPLHARTHERQNQTAPVCKRCLSLLPHDTESVRLLGSSFVPDIGGVSVGIAPPRTPPLQDAHRKFTVVNASHAQPPLHPALPRAVSPELQTGSARVGSGGSSSGVGSSSSSDEHKQVSGGDSSDDARGGLRGDWADGGGYEDAPSSPFGMASTPEIVKEKRLFERKLSEMKRNGKRRMSAPNLAHLGRSEGEREGEGEERVHLPSIHNSRDPSPAKRSVHSVHRSSLHSSPTSHSRAINSTTINSVNSIKMGLLETNELSPRLQPYRRTRRSSMPDIRTGRLDPGGSPLMLQRRLSVENLCGMASEERSGPLSTQEAMRASLLKPGMTTRFFDMLGDFDSEHEQDRRASDGDDAHSSSSSSSSHNTAQFAPTSRRPPPHCSPVTRGRSIAHASGHSSSSTPSAAATHDLNPTPPLPHGDLASRSSWRASPRAEGSSLLPPVNPNRPSRLFTPKIKTIGS